MYGANESFESFDDKLLLFFLCFFFLSFYFVKNACPSTLFSEGTRTDRRSRLIPEKGKKKEEKKRKKKKEREES